ncbi:MAG: hypothetical protein WCQ53_08195 [bacterium]
MKRKAAVIALVFIGLLSGPAWTKVLATVGQENITMDDIDKIREQLNPALDASLSDEDILNQLIDMKVGLMDAKLTGVDQKQGAKEAMDMALFNYYRAAMVDNSYKNKKFSKKEITDFYATNPVVKFQRLALPFDPSDKKDQQRVFTKISILRSDIQAKKLTFEAAIEKLGAEASSNFSGTFDKIPLPALDGAEASELRSIAPMELSSVVIGNNYVCIVRLLKVYPISTENYSPINERLKMEAIAKARTAYFKSLRQRYSNYVSIQR